ncbi:MAG: aldose epimerase family protein [Pseudomonadota bacterium]
MRVIGRFNDRDVTEVVLESSRAAVHIMNYGAVIRDWRVDVDGSAKPMVLGYREFDDYPEHSRSFGTITGRVANRTAGGRFTLDGVQHQLEVNKGPNHLHGGSAGLGTNMWDMERDGDSAVRLTHVSPDGAAGYPGRAAFAVTYRLDGGRLDIEIDGAVDAPSPINIAQHNYYTLGADAGMRHCAVRVDAEGYTPTDETQIPTGEILAVHETRFDFREMKSFAEADPDEQGIDHNLVLREGRDLDQPAAEGFNPDTGKTLSIWTDQPGIQLFNAWHFDLPKPGLDGIKMGNYPGFCLEPQHFPDSVNKPQWPSIIYGPDRPYRQVMGIEIL